MTKHKLYSGESEGRLGSQTRAAVRQAQIKYRLPADGYPNQALLDRLRGYSN